MNTYQMLRSQVPAAGASSAGPEMLAAPLAPLLAQFPALGLLANTPQDPCYHAEGDVWTHTGMVLQALIESCDYASANDDERFVLFYAALLHDIAKPDTTVIDEATGRIGQPGHCGAGIAPNRA